MKFRMNASALRLDVLGNDDMQLLSYSVKDVEFNGDVAELISQFEQLALGLDKPLDTRS